MPVIVKGEGNLSSLIWLIGDAPGVTEEKNGVPFCGGSGYILNSILTDAGIDRKECYIDNVIRTRPYKNSFGSLYFDKLRKSPKPELIEAQKNLRTLVNLHKPNIVVALGEEALRALTDKIGIMSWRSSILECGDVKIIPTLHPSVVMKIYKHRPEMLFDLVRAKKESKSPNKSIPYSDNFICNPSFDCIMYNLEELRKREKITFDIETQMNQINCIGFGWSKQDAICVPIFYGKSNWWTKTQETMVILEIKRLLENPNIGFIAQNSQFDMTYLADLWGISVKNLYMDTMIAHHCVYPELPKSLAFMTSIYTNRNFYKDMGTTPDMLWKYNCLDCVATYECADEIEKELRDFNTYDFYMNHSHKLIMPLHDIMRMGIRIDIDKKQKVRDNLAGDKIRLQKKLNEAVGHEVNVNSPKQMQALLYDEMRFPVKKKRSTGKTTTDIQAIKELAKKYPNPMFDLILDIRHIGKLVSTYLDAPVDKDGRIRCSYKIHGTVTGRLASSESIYGSGTNLQNIPRGELIRSLFIPDDGKYLVEADYSQAEARVVAYIAQDKMLMDVFDEGGDVHTRNACMVFGKSRLEITKKERNLAKSLVHAANYGIGARTFGAMIGKTTSEAQDLLNQYFAMYPRIKIWHRDVEYELGKTRMLSNPFGRKRAFMNRWSKDLIREAMAFVPQSTVGDLLNKALVQVYNHLPDEWNILLQVHDSIVLQVPQTVVPQQLWKFLYTYMTVPIKIDNNVLKIPITIKCGKDWGTLKEIENIATKGD